MSEEEKKAIETLKGLTVYYDDYSLLDEEEIEENDNINKSIQLIIDLIERLEKELNTLKEIEQAHKTDNGLLRQELDLQIEHNKELEEKLKITVAIITKGMYPEQNEGDNDFDKQFISKDKIETKLNEYTPKTTIHYPENIDNFINAIRCCGRVEAYEELLEEK